MDPLTQKSIEKHKRIVKNHDEFFRSAFFANRKLNKKYYMDQFSIFLLGSHHRAGYNSSVKILIDDVKELIYKCFLDATSNDNIKKYTLYGTKNTENDIKYPTYYCMNDKLELIYYYKPSSYYSKKIPVIIFGDKSVVSLESEGNIEYKVRKLFSFKHESKNVRYKVNIKYILYIARINKKIIKSNYVEKIVLEIEKHSSETDYVYNINNDDDNGDYNEEEKCNDDEYEDEDDEKEEYYYNDEHYENDENVYFEPDTDLCNYYYLEIDLKDKSILIHDLFFEGDNLEFFSEDSPTRYDKDYMVLQKSIYNKIASICYNYRYFNNQSLATIINIIEKMRKRYNAIGLNLE